MTLADKARLLVANRPSTGASEEELDTWAAQVSDAFPELDTDQVVALLNVALATQPALAGPNPVRGAA